MRRVSCAVLFLLLLITTTFAVTDRPVGPLNGIPLIQPEAGEFSFAVIGDFRPSRRDRPYPDVYGQILKELNLIAPAFIISTGDAYYGYGGTVQKFKNEVDYFMSSIRALDVPFINAPGNHEVAGDPVREEHLKRIAGSLYGSFDFRKTHFVMLNTEELGKEGAITGEQLQWLEKDLAANAGAEHIFVFMHRPLFSEVDPELAAGKSFKDRDNRDYLHRLFAAYKVRAVFTGHEHLYSEMVKDGVRYIITGGGGAPLYRHPRQGGFFHYLIARVKDGEVVIDVLVPHSLQVRTIAGNDGFEPRAELELANISNAELRIGNLAFRMPRAAAGKYLVRALEISKMEKASEYRAKIRRVKDNGDGTASVSVETGLPKNGAIRVIVETDLNN